VARIQLGGKLGYIDGACNIVVAPRFDKAEDFHEGLAWVMIKGENSGYINKAGTFVWTDSEE
jgi:hypothetical protein